MNATQTTLEPARLLQLYGLLTLYEMHHGPVCGISILRKRVLEDARRVAPYVPAAPPC
jgi:hypothetical protein